MIYNMLYFNYSSVLFYNIFIDFKFSIEKWFITITSQGFIVCWRRESNRFLNRAGLSRRGTITDVLSKFPGAPFCFLYLLAEL